MHPRGIYCTSDHSAPRLGARCNMSREVELSSLVLRAAGSTSGPMDYGPLRWSKSGARCGHASHIIIGEKRSARPHSRSPSASLTCSCERTLSHINCCQADHLVRVHLRPSYEIIVVTSIAVVASSNIPLSYRSILCVCHTECHLKVDCVLGRDPFVVSSIFHTVNANHESRYQLRVIR